MRTYVALNFFATANIHRTHRQHVAAQKFTDSLACCMQPFRTSKRQIRNEKQTFETGYNYICDTCNRDIQNEKKHTDMPRKMSLG